MLDLHIVMLLRDKWKAVVADRSGVIFKSFFQMLPEPVLDSWFEALAPDGDATNVLITPTFVPEKGKMPQITVRLQDNPLEIQPLGFYSHENENLAPVYSIFLREELTITILDGNPETMRALYEFVRKAMLLSARFLVSAGYEGIEYVGGGDFDIEAGLLPEQLGVYARNQRWAFTSQNEIADTEVGVHKDVFVHAEDVSVGTKKGGVSPIT